MPGRRKGSRNTGFFHRNGRGWYVKDSAGKFVALLNESGERLRDRGDTEAAKDSYARWRLAAKQAAPAPEAAESARVWQVCEAYLAQVRAESGERRTYCLRKRILFEFCTGLSPKFMDREKSATKADRKHDGFGKMPVAELKRLHVDKWVQAHPEWNGGRRTMLQAVKRAFNYGVECGMIAASPLKGYKVDAPNARATYLTPAQEQAIYDHAKPAFAMAIRVLVATGARPGCEFCNLTVRHVRDHGERMEWIFAPSESKTKKERRIRISDPEIIAIVRKQIAAHKSGPVFFSDSGAPWTIANLSDRFRTIKRKLARKGIELDADSVLYATRHTAAKRWLEGSPTRRPVSMATVSKLLGNSLEVCTKHYANWGGEADHLWAALG